mgnify:CR=1 FL=1
MIILSFAFKYDYNPFDVDSVITSSLLVSTSDPLYEEIVRKSEELNEDAEDAYIDRVWKKTPGRDGLRVNIEASYENMKKDKKFDETKLVMESVKPKTNLSDLPASPIYRGHPEKQMVSLLINVSWGTEYIPDILQTLKEKNVKASFFIEGKWALSNPNVVQMVKEQNHLIGNHAYNHPDMARINREEIFEQINETNSILQAITGDKPKYFAPPSGSFNDEVVTIAHQLEMETILWTVDTIDWKRPSVSVMVNRVMSKIHPGATILMHPTEPVAKGLADLIDQIKEKGYKIGTIEQLLSTSRN